MEILVITGFLAVAMIAIFAADGNVSAAASHTGWIDINADRQRLEVPCGESLFAALHENGIFLPSACGGRGLCGYCRCEVLEGAGPLTEAETKRLSEDEIAANVRLACQVMVTGDMKIRIPSELLSVGTFRGLVERIDDLTHDIKYLRFRLIAPERIEFVPGQYVQLEAPAYGNNPDPVFRAYSIASAPGDNRHVELIVRLVPGGICTTWVFEHLREGDEVKFAGPFGEFRLSDSDRPMYWVAGGSGMAPFWSLVRHMKDNGIERPTMYFFGAVSRRDMFFERKMAELEKLLPWFTYVPALSGETSPDWPGDWPGERGLITEVMERRVGDGPEAEAYLCGSPGMIDAACKVLRAKGVTDERIYYDKFA